MNKLRNALAVAVLAALAAASSVQAADLIPVNLDGANEGYNDNTPATPVGGNYGTTKGEQRR
ncbi:MAG TPA: peptidase, partial [Thermomonas sp.]|nr:peptidase [Thermomonas sp.]